MGISCKTQVKIQLLNWIVGGIKDGKGDEHSKISHCDSAKDIDETDVALPGTSNQRTDYVLHKPPNDLAISSDCETNKASLTRRVAYVQGGTSVWLDFIWAVDRLESRCYYSPSRTCRVNPNLIPSR